MAQEYEPFGHEWVSEMMKWRKVDIINFLRQKLMEVKKPSYNSASGQCPLCRSEIIARTVTMCLNKECRYNEMSRAQPT